MSKGKLLAVAIVWLIILGVGVGVWRLVFAPVVEQSQAERQREEMQRGGSDSLYKQRLTIALDGFSGYAVLRSREFAEDLRKQGIKVQLKDDGADYTARLAGLKRGDTDMAVFTIDALVKTSAAAGSLPATIVAMIDDTVGADAIVAYKERLPNVDALNHPDTKFVLTPDSPSETLARVVMSRFQLDELGDQPFINATDAADVVAKYKRGKPTDRLAYVLWEPYVTQVLQNDRMHVVVDSSRFPSAIADVLVVSDDFLAKNRETVVEVVKAYFRANYKYREPTSRAILVKKDAAAGGAKLTDEEARRLVDGVWWKNTQENLAHMGKAGDSRLPHVEDLIASITGVLLETGAITKDPTDGNPNYLYNAGIWDDLANFRPGTQAEKVRGTQLPALSDQQWESLVPAGTARAPRLVFARGTDRLTGRSRSLLDELAGTLGATRYYVTVRGNASRRGNAEANKRLAQQRAKAVEDYLVGHGVDADRIRAVGVEPSGDTSVTFVLGEPPY